MNQSLEVDGRFDSSIVLDETLCFCVDAVVEYVSCEMTVVIGWDSVGKAA